jgi:putative colanic acid biosynthesis acetyltransferase WcaF
VAVDLSRPDVRGYRPGRPFVVRALWLVVEALVLRNPILTSYGLKRATLRLFGARIGRNVLVKPSVAVKYPWHLSVGDNSWIGERAWLDTVVPIRIGANVCVSQGAYLCTGNHDWSDPRMGLVTGEIVLEDGSWVGAFARVGPGVTVGREAVVALGAVLVEDAEPHGVYVGNPAVRVRERRLRDPQAAAGAQPALNAQ